jgi:hypothetical protein
MRTENAPRRDWSIALYRVLIRAYPERFRTRYGQAILDAFVSELDAVRSRSSASALIAFWTFMITDGLVGIVATRGSDARRRISHSAKVLRASTGFLAALTTLAVMPIWAWSRFATHSAGHADQTTLVFCVSALHAIVIWVLANSAAGIDVRGRRITAIRYITVRRARIVARVARASTFVFLVAAIAEARRGRVERIPVDPTISIGYWLMLSLTFAGLIAIYFAMGKLLGPLRVPDGAYLSFTSRRSASPESQTGAPPPRN